MKPKIIVTPMGGGKTTQLLKLAHEMPGYNLIVVNTRREVMRLWDIIQRGELDVPMPVTYQELTNGDCRGKNINSFLMDNAEYFLRQFTGHVPVAAIAMSSEDAPLDPRADPEVRKYYFELFMREMERAADASDGRY